MRKIVEDGGKFYAEAVVRIGEVTQASLAADLATLIAQKALAVSEKEAEYDEVIADMQRQIDELAALEA